MPVLLGLLILLGALLTVDHRYGPIFYATITGQKQEYYIGRACEADLADCEKKFFQSYLDRISYIKNADRDYFADFYIRDDQADYTGNCPCPDNSDSRGYMCGGRSSYSKGGQISYCYSSDVADYQIDDKKEELLDNARYNLTDVTNHAEGVYREKITTVILFVISAFGIGYNKKRLFKS